MSTATQEATSGRKSAQSSAPTAGVRPPSVTNGYINSVGLGGAFLVLFATVALGLNPIIGALACVAAYALPIIVLEIFTFRILSGCFHSKTQGS